MNKKIIISILIAILIIVIGVLIIYKLIENNVINRENFKFNVESISSEIVNTENINESKVVKEMYIKVNNKTLTVTLEDNSSTEALLEKLKQEDITINMKDYANFEKIGELNFSLPRNDKQITTEAGDIILYQGNSITIYYDTNRWNFTKLGKINDITQKELKDLLGSGDVTITFTLKQ